MELFFDSKKILPNDEITLETATYTPEVIIPEGTFDPYTIILRNLDNYYINWVYFNNKDFFPYEAPDTLGEYVIEVYSGDLTDISKLRKRYILNLKPIYSIRFQIIEYPKIPYAIVKSLGQGTYGKVYKILKDDKYYALKEFKRTNDSDSILEVDILSRCDHPNIISILEIIRTGTERCVIYFVMDLAEEGTLKTFMERMPNLNKLSLAKELMCGVSYLHKNGIIHRDLKPDNILMFQGHPKISDFGTSLNVIKPIQIVTAGITTIWWRAPELLLFSFRNRRDILTYDYGIDIWALGCIFYELVTGKRIIDGTDAEECLYQINRRIQHLTDNQINAIDLREKINPKLGYEIQGRIVDMLNMRGPVPNEKYFGQIPAFVDDNMWRSLILQMLEVDYTKRINAEQCLTLLNYPECSTPIIENPLTEIQNVEYLKIRSKLIELLISNLEENDLLKSLAPATYILGINIMDRYFNLVPLTSVKRPRKISKACVVIAASVLYSNIDIPAEFSQEMCDIMETLDYKLFQRVIGLDWSIERQQELLIKLRIK
jgi:serine/threonine protein kinase